MKSKKNELITMLLYIIYVVSYLVTLRIFSMGDSVSRIRYYLLAIMTFVGIAFLFVNRKNVSIKKTIYFKEIFFILLTGLVFFALSFYKAVEAGMNMNIRTIVQISLFVLPALYAYVLINTLSISKIMTLMKFTLLATIIVYFTEPRHTLPAFFELKNWLAVRPFSSISFTESSLCSSVFTHLYFFFSFYDIKTTGRDKSLKLCSILAFIFTILCFKRLSILFVIFFAICKMIVIYSKKDTATFKMPKYSYIVVAIIFVVLTMLYTKFMNGEIFTNINLYKLTTGRDYIIRLWKNHNFFSYGYGTSMLVIDRYLEMDLIQIYLELNVVALLIFCLSFFKLTRNALYSIVIVAYEFLNLLTSSSLPSSLMWIILIVTVICVSTNKEANLNET